MSPNVETTLKQGWDNFESTMKQHLSVLCNVASTVF